MKSRTTAIPALVALIALLLGLLAGCSDEPDETALGTSASEEVAALRMDAQRLLSQRARGIREDNLRLFMRGVDVTDVELVARQRRYFENLRQLPLRVFRYQLLDRIWPTVLARPAWGKDVFLPQIRLSTQLAAFDAGPVDSLTGFAFARRDGVLKIVGDRTRSGTPFPESRPAPWELTSIKVLDSGGVLGLYDASTFDRAEVVNAAVLDGVYSVQRMLPFNWPGRVVVYVFDDPEVLNGFGDVPGGNITHLGAMTFPVFSQTDQRVVGSRFVLLPTSVSAGQPFLGRIIRHELTHVAVGQRDDGDPTWLSEGIAEYLGARDIEPSRRRIATVAVGRARAGVSAMPPSTSFNGPDQEWNYALSWMACDYIADTQGEAKLWELVREMHGGGRGTSDENQDGVLIRLIGMDNTQLARRAANRILRIYG